MYFRLRSRKGKRTLQGDILLKFRVSTLTNLYLMKIIDDFAHLSEEGNVIVDFVSIKF